MKTAAHALRQIVEDFTGKINGINDAEFSAKPLPNKWSKKEVLGHLIDSAQNNLRRFVCAQYESTPPKIVYDQDQWVNINGYQEMKKEDIVLMWKLINFRICSILENMPEKNYDKHAVTSEPRTMTWLAEDYVRHMKHHMNQIIPGAFDIVYKS
jgi:hypothetical protein